MTRFHSTNLAERSRMRVDALRPYERNPRTISRSALESLKRSLEEDRELLEARPLLVNMYPGRENVVVAGNMRLRAAQELGWDEIPVLLVSLPPDIEAQWNLKDNNQWGDYIAQDLAEMLTELDSRGIDIDILGFGKDEIERLLALVTATAGSDDDDFDPTPPSFPQTRPGDLVILGPHRLVCGDSREPSTWNLLMQPSGGVAADAVWTDPPYGVDLAGVALPSRGDAQDLALVGDLPGEVAPLLASVFANIDRWLKPGAPFYVAGPHGRMAVPFVQEVEGVGWHLSAQGDLLRLEARGATHLAARGRSGHRDRRRARSQQDDPTGADRVCEGTARKPGSRRATRRQDTSQRPPPRR